MRRFLATAVLASFVLTLLGCGATPGPSSVIYWAEAKFHVTVTAIDAATDTDTWLVTFEMNGKKMQAPTSPGMNRPAVIAGDTALLLGKISQSGDLLITSITREAATSSPVGTEGDPSK